MSAYLDRGGPMGAHVGKWFDIEDLIDDAIEAYPDAWAITAEEYDSLYQSLLGYYLQHGVIPEFTLNWGAVQ